jgi:hypothetical protein
MCIAYIITGVHSLTLTLNISIKQRTNKEKSKLYYVAKGLAVTDLRADKA